MYMLHLLHQTRNETYKENECVEGRNQQEVTSHVQDAFQQFYQILGFFVLFWAPYADFG